MPLIILTLFNILITILIYALLPYKFIIINTGFKVVGLLVFAAMLLISLLTLLHDKKNLKNVLHGIITTPIFMLSWFFINVVAFTKKKLEWKPIQHIKSVNVGEMQKL